MYKMHEFLSKYWAITLIVILILFYILSNKYKSNEGYGGLISVQNGWQAQKYAIKAFLNNDIDSIPKYVQIMKIIAEDPTRWDRLGWISSITAWETIYTGDVFNDDMPEYMYKVKNTTADIAFSHSINTESCNPPEKLAWFAMLNFWNRMGSTYTRADIEYIYKCLDTAIESRPLY